MLQWILKKPGTERKAALKALVFLVAVFCFMFLPFAFVSAQTGTPGASSQITAADTGVDVLAAPLGLPNTDIRLFIARIIRIALGFLGTIMFVLMLYGGFLWMTAGGNSEQIDKAKQAGYDPSALRRLAIDGKIPARKIGKQWVIAREDLEKWMAGKGYRPRSGRPRKQAEE
jgi:excisionase family DNA binding protein